MYVGDRIRLTAVSNHGRSGQTMSLLDRVKIDEVQVPLGVPAPSLTRKYRYPHPLSIPSDAPSFLLPGLAFSFSSPSPPLLRPSFIASASLSSSIVHGPVCLPSVTRCLFRFPIIPHELDISGSADHLGSTARLVLSVDHPLRFLGVHLSGTPVRRHNEALARSRRRLPHGSCAGHPPCHRGQGTVHLAPLSSTCGRIRSLTSLVRRIRETNSSSPTMALNCKHRNCPESRMHRLTHSQLHAWCCLSEYVNSESRILPCSTGGN